MISFYKHFVTIYIWPKTNSRVAGYIADFCKGRSVEIFIYLVITFRKTYIDEIGADSFWFQQRPLTPDEKSKVSNC